MENLFRNLNPQQQEAVRAIKGPVLIIAAAGSGKTRVLTYRLAYLIAQGVPPEQIMAVTFTNKAANEMKKRVDQLLKTENYKLKTVPVLGTFHSLCAKILRQELDYLDFPYRRNFVIYDTEDQLKVVKKAMEQLAIDSKRFPPRAVLAQISGVKTEMREPEEYQNQAKEFFPKVVAKIYPLYQQELAQNNALDFDDLIWLTLKAFQKYPALLAKYQDRFRYLLVDEYQDTNKPQYLFLKLLAQKHQNIMAVGDDYQGIYRFRQADIRNILSFEKDYPEAKIIFLEQNYRSTKTILAAAQKVIAHNQWQRHKKLWTENQVGEKIVLQETANEEAEARWIVEKIKAGQRGGEVLGSFCVLYRTHAQSRALEEALLQTGLPYQIVGGLKFYERKEIKDVLAYLRLIVNPQDQVSLERISNIPARGLGLKSLRRWLASSSLENFIPQQTVLLGLTAPAQKGLVRLYQTWDRLCRQAENKTLSGLIKFLLSEINYQNYLQEKTAEPEARWENVRELLTVTNKYPDLKARQSLPVFLEEVALIQETDQREENRPGVILMTIHAAKGLEFPEVFLVGLEEGVFPHNRSLLDPQELEEERRLCYVALTRAQKQLYLTHCQSRMLYGFRQANPLSRFAAEIPPEYLQIKKISRTRDFNPEDFIDYDD